MAFSVAPSDGQGKNPVKVKAGMIGARTRWGAPRIIRLDALTPRQRQGVVDLVQTMKPAPTDTDGWAVAAVLADAVELLTADTEPER